jgi:hypothetical protein
MTVPPRDVLKSIDIDEFPRIHTGYRANRDFSAVPSHLRNELRGAYARMAIGWPWTNIIA